MATTQPKVTVVTISFNAEKFIRKTLESVIAQDYPNLEYLVIDGGSKDSTPAIIREYADKPQSRISSWVSEKDSGVSEAFNKGIARHTGDFIGYMNAGDYFASPDALSRLFSTLESTPDADIVFGKARLTFENAPEKIVGSPLIGSPQILSHKLPTAHQAIYYHRRVWENFGAFSMDYRYAMDYEHYHRLKNRTKWAFSDVIVAERPLTPARNSFGNPSRTYREYLKADWQHRNPAIVLNCAKFLRDKIKETLR